MSVSASAGRMTMVVRLALLAATAIATAVIPLARTSRLPVDREAIANADAAYAAALSELPKGSDESRDSFLKAAEAFAASDPARRSAGAIFNEANARLSAGELGQAIACYREALALDPADAKILANLAEARRQVVGSPGVPDPTAMERASRFWSFVPERARLNVTVALLWIGVALLVLDARLRTFVWIPTILAFAIGSTVVVDLARRANSSDAVVVEPAVVRKGNGEGFDPAIAEPLPEGTECRVIERRAGWTEIEIAGPTRGWVRERSVREVVPRPQGAIALGPGTGSTSSRNE